MAQNTGNQNSERGGWRRRAALLDALRDLRVGDVFLPEEEAGEVVHGAAEIACAGNLALTFFHIMLGVGAVLAPFLLPWWALKWALGFIPMALLAFALFGDCPLTLAESAMAAQCATKYGDRGSVLPPVPLTPDEARNRSPAFAAAFQTNFIRRFAFWALGARLSASDCRGIMMVLWGVTYLMFLVRSGDISRGCRAFARVVAGMAEKNGVVSAS